MHTEDIAVYRNFVDCVLENYQKGTLRTLMNNRLSADEKKLTQQLAIPVQRVGGTLFPPSRLEEPILLLFQWGIIQLGPEVIKQWKMIEKKPWLTQRKWWPVVLMMCHHGFADVPKLPSRYYRHPAESIGDYLCRLWEISRATYYRYLRQAKTQIAKLLSEQHLGGIHTLNIQKFIQHQFYANYQLITSLAQQEWHWQQADHFLQMGDYVANIWHLRMVESFDVISKNLALHITEIAQDALADQEITALKQASMPGIVKVDILRSLAAVYRVRNDAQNELKIYNEARQLANKFDNKLALAGIYSELGQYYEGRDSDKALAHYQLSLDFWESVKDGDFEQIEGYAYTLIRLAWLYALRNDPRAEFLLERADHLQLNATSYIRANLERAQGEYWRRRKVLNKALEHTQRALSIDELLANEQGIVIDYLNLGAIYEEMNQFNEAISYYEKIQTLANTAVVNPEQLVGAYLNLGICHFYLHNYEAAIHEYKQGLEKSISAGLRLLTGRAHYNLAETYYTQFLVTKDGRFLQPGDAHRVAAVRAFRSGNFLVELEAADSLKVDLLEGTKKDNEQQILPQEKAIHFAEMVAIEKERSLIAAESNNPKIILKGQIAIAKHYLDIAVQERNQALKLCDKYKLQRELGSEIKHLHDAFAQAIIRETYVMRRWQTVIGVYLPEVHWHAVLHHLQKYGSIKKGVYAELCDVSPSTASKHLKFLAEQNLIRRQGNGRNTHYILEVV